MPMLRRSGAMKVPLGGAENRAGRRSEFPRTAAVPSPAMQRSVVVLPQPLGPSKRKQLALAHFEGHAAQRPHLALGAGEGFLPDL